MGGFGPRLDDNPQIGGVSSTEARTPAALMVDGDVTATDWVNDEVRLRSPQTPASAALERITASNGVKAWHSVDPPRGSSAWGQTLTGSSCATYKSEAHRNVEFRSFEEKEKALMHQGSWGAMSIHPWLEGNNGIGRTVRIADFRSLRRFLIHPEESLAMCKWETVMMLSLIFVCLVTPYEVAFIAADDSDSLFSQLDDPMFWLNRLTDVIFVMDIGLQFFVMYPVERRFGAVYVSDRKLIVRNYMRKWFFIDVVSVFPFELLGVLVDADNLVRFRLFRVVRLLRLFKLFRLLRGLRILRRWEAEMKTSYRRLTLWGLLVTVFFAAHWMTCFLGLVSILQGEPCRTMDEPPFCVRTWFTPYARKMSEQGFEATGLREYLAVLSVVSTILVHPYAAEPENALEQACFTVMIFLGGFIWTRVISRTTAVYTSLDRHRIFYRQTMDDLNRNMMDQMLTDGLQSRLRSFFMSMRDSSQRSTWSDLQKRMSPSLRIQVAVELHTVWLRRVPFLAGSSRFLIAALAQRIETEHYAQQETFGLNFRLYVMNKGVCSRTLSRRGRFRLHLPGSVWGLEHLVFQTVNLLEPNSAATMTFSEVLVLTRGDFEEVTIEFPENAQRIHKYYIKMAVIRGIIKYARQQRLLQEADAAAAGLAKLASGDLGEPDHEEGEYLDHAARMKRELARKTQRFPVQHRLSDDSGLTEEHENSSCPVPHACTELQELEERLSAQISRSFGSLTLQLEAFKAEMRQELRKVKRRHPHADTI